MKTILLTGGNGFIGKNIKDSFLSEKYHLLAPSSQDLNLAETEQVDAFFEQNNIDFVIHSAVKPGHRNANDLNDLVYTNTRLFLNLVRHSEKYEKMLNLGSGAIYDMRYYKPKMPENYAFEHIPIDAHGYTKYVCGNLIEKSNHIYDLRIFGVFGKHEDYAIRFISNAICKTLFDLPITLRQNRMFDYLWIDDLMPILDWFLDHEPQHKSYNITPNKAVSLLDLAKLVNEISGKNLPIKVANEGFGMEYSGDNSQLKTEIKNIQFTEPEIAIRQLFEWYKTHKNKLDKKLLLVDK